MLNGWLHVRVINFRIIIIILLLWCKGRLTGRHTDHPAGRHSIRTNQCPPPLSPIFYRPDALPAAQPTASKHWRQLALLLLTDSQKTENGCHDDEDAQLLRNFRTRRFEINLTVTWDVAHCHEGLNICYISCWKLYILMERMFMILSLFRKIDLHYLDVIVVPMKLKKSVVQIWI